MLLASAIVAIPLGDLRSRDEPAAERVALGIASGALQTVPSLALLAFLITDARGWG